VNGNAKAAKPAKPELPWGFSGFRVQDGIGDVRRAEPDLLSGLGGGLAFKTVVMWGAQSQICFASLAGYAFKTVQHGSDSQL
jgi:hypothetical protein